MHAESSSNSQLQRMELVSPLDPVKQSFPSLFALSRPEHHYESIDVYTLSVFQPLQPLFFLNLKLTHLGPWAAFHLPAPLT